MKIKQHLTLTVVTAALSAPLVGAQQMGGGMGGGMGMGGNMPQELAQIDKDGDSLISKDELGAFVPSRRLDAVFESWDTNKDGNVDAAEFTSRGK